MSKRFQLRMVSTLVEGNGKLIAKKDLPAFIEKAQKERIPIAGISGMETGPLKAHEPIYIITTKDKKDKNLSQNRFEVRNACHHFYSQMFDLIPWSTIYRLALYEERKEAVNKACKKLNLDKRVEAYMQVEFTAMDMCAMAFSTGFVLGDTYEVKDRRYYDQVKKFIEGYLPYVEKKISYIKKVKRNVEKKAA